MLNKLSIALAASLVLGTASMALAEDFDANTAAIFAHNSAAALISGAPSQTRHVRGVTSQEQVEFQRANGAVDSGN